MFRPGAKLGDDLFHPGQVASLPIDAIALWASEEDGEMGEDEIRNLSLCPLLLQRNQSLIAHDTTPEAVPSGPEAKAPDDLTQLFPPMIALDEQDLHPFYPGEVMIPGENRPLLPPGLLDEGIRMGGRGIGYIITQDSQPFG